MIRTLRYFVLWCLPVLVAVADEPAPARAAPPAEYTRHLDAGKALLDRGDIDGAQQELLQATKTDGTQKWAFFYLAVTYYRQGDLQRAVEASLTAYQNVGEDREDANTKIFELRHFLERRIEANTFRDEGDQAYNSGLIAKAAHQYAWAYELDGTQGDLALKAAALYADRLDRLFDAALIWQDVVHGAEPHATAARAELQSHREALDALLRRYLTHRDEWPMDTNKLAQAFPESMEMHVEIAADYAKMDAASAVANHLGAAIRLGYTKEALVARSEFVDLTGISDENGRGDEFREFVRDAYGDDVLTKMKTEAKRRSDEVARIAREKAEKERLAKLEQERKEKLAKLEQERKQLNAWRNAERLKILQSVNNLFGDHNGVEVDLLPGPKVAKKKKTPRKTITRTTTLSIGGGHYNLVTKERIRVYRDKTPETAWDHTVSIPSFAGFVNVVVEPSTWAEATDPDFVAGMPHTPLCKSALLIFSGPTRISIDHALVDAATGQRLTGSTEDSGAAVRFNLMIGDPDVPRLKPLFDLLAKLDAAGADLDKLRAVRAKWGG